MRKKSFTNITVLATLLSTMLLTGCGKEVSTINNEQDEFALAVENEIDNNSMVGNISEHTDESAEDKATTEATTTATTEATTKTTTEASTEATTKTTTEATTRTTTETTTSTVAVTEAPKTEAPKTEAPKTEEPRTEAPKTEAPKTEAPTEATTEVVTTEVVTEATTEAVKEDVCDGVHCKYENVGFVVMSYVPEECCIGIGNVNGSGVEKPTNYPDKICVNGHHYAIGYRKETNQEYDFCTYCRQIFSRNQDFLSHCIEVHPDVICGDGVGCANAYNIYLYYEQCTF